MNVLKIKANYAVKTGMVTRDEVNEYNKLKSELFGNDMFVVMDDSDPRVSRYNDLMRKIFFWT